MKTNTHFFYHNSLNSSLNDKYFRQNCRANQNTYFAFDNFPPPPENRAVYEIM